MMGRLFTTLFIVGYLCWKASPVSSSFVEASIVPVKASPGFKCIYPGYTNCNSKKDRSCWVRKGSKTYDVDTDYEDDFPVGVTRTVSYALKNL